MTEQRHLSERLTNLLAVLSEIEAEAENLTDNDRNADIFSRIEDAGGIVGEMVFMVVGEAVDEVSAALCKLYDACDDDEAQVGEILHEVHKSVRNRNED